MGEERKSSPGRIAASMKYNDKNVTQFKMALNNTTDKDIIDHLHTKENKQGYVKNLIRNDMKRGDWNEN